MGKVVLVAVVLGPEGAELQVEAEVLGVGSRSGCQYLLDEAARVPEADSFHVTDNNYDYRKVLSHRNPLNVLHQLLPLFLTTPLILSSPFFFHRRKLFFSGQKFHLGQSPVLWFVGLQVVDGLNFGQQLLKRRKLQI